MSLMHEIQYKTRLITDAATEPISTAEAKDHCRVDTSDDDTYIGTLIKAARLYAEGRTKRSFITTTWALYMDAFPLVIHLEHPPFIAITTFQYTNTSGTTGQTVTSSIYQTDTATEPGRVALAENKSWPDTQSGTFNVATLTYTAGYGAASDVPGDIQHAIKMLVKQWYDVREPFVVGQAVAYVPFAVKALLDPYVVDFFR